MLLGYLHTFFLLAMHVNSLCACSHSEAMKGSSSFRLLILSRLLASPDGPNWRSLTPSGGLGPSTSKMASLLTGSAYTPLPGFRTLPLRGSSGFVPWGFSGSSPLPLHCSHIHYLLLLFWHCDDYCPNPLPCFLTRTHFFVLDRQGRFSLCPPLWLRFALRGVLTWKLTKLKNKKIHLPEGPFYKNFYTKPILAKTANNLHCT